MNEEITKFERALVGLLNGYVGSVVKGHPNLKGSVVVGRNDAFPMRVFAAFKSSNADRELAVTVELRKRGDQLVLTSDICWDGGEVLCDGPSQTFPELGGQSHWARDLSLWLGTFEFFLHQSRSVVSLAMAKL